MLDTTNARMYWGIVFSRSAVKGHREPTYWVKREINVCGIILQGMSASSELLLIYALSTCPLMGEYSLRRQSELQLL
jgi:hypothetical protein